MVFDACFLAMLLMGCFSCSFEFGWIFWAGRLCWLLVLVACGLLVLVV